MRVRFAPRARLIVSSKVHMDNSNQTYKPKLGSNPILILLAIFLIFLGAVGQFANFMHGRTIKEFEEKGKLYSGPVTDNYFFYTKNFGHRTLTKTNYMVCFKPDVAPSEGYDLLCSSEYISRSLAKQLPVGTRIDAYWREDIYDVLLVPGINTWRNSWFLQYVDYLLYGAGLVLFLVAKIMKRFKE